MLLVVVSCHSGRPVKCLVRILSFLEIFRVFRSLEAMPTSFRTYSLEKVVFSRFLNLIFVVVGCVGGCTPQVQQMNQLLSLSQGLSGPQLMTLMQGLQEQMTTQARLTPDTFGEVPTLGGVSVNQGVPDLTFGVDGFHNELGQAVPLDVFSKSEKWLGVGGTSIY